MEFHDPTDESDPDGYDVWQRRELAARDRSAATWLGTLGGAMGGAAMLLVARAMMAHAGRLTDPAVSLGERLPQSSVPPQIVGLAIAAIAGAILGAVLGRSTWRVTRVAPRILFFSIMVPAVWLCVQVVIAGRMSQAAAAAAPFVPYLVGSLAFALFVAVLPAVRRARVVEILPEKK